MSFGNIHILHALCSVFKIVKLQSVIQCATISPLSANVRPCCKDCNGQIMREGSFWNPRLPTLLGEHTESTLALQFCSLVKSNSQLISSCALEEIIRGQKGLPAVSYMNVQPNFTRLCRLAEAKFLVTPTLVLQHWIGHP